MANDRSFQPLSSNFRIVDDNGFPNDYFIRWAQQRQIDLLEGITIEQAQQLIDDWAAARRINTTAPISGGGPLSDDLTLTHAASGVAAATYGDATHVPQITVDAKGHVTAAANVAIAGGGGGAIFSMPPTAMERFDVGTNACMGNIVILKEGITVSDLYGSINNSTVGNVYNMFIATVNSGTGAIISTVATTPSFITTATGGQTNKFTFSTPIALVPGAYLFGIVRTNGTGSSQCNSIYGASAISYPNLPIDAGEMFRLYTSSVRATTYATNASSPVAAATTGISTTAIYAIGIKFTY